MTHAMMGPVLAQVFLTLVVLLTLFARRLPALSAMKPTNEQLQDRANLAKLPAPARFAAENLGNLAEMPMQFYALAIAAMAAGLESPLAVQLAWAYVGLRAVHSFIHCTYNKVMHRFIAYLLSTFVLIGFFGVLVFNYWGA